MFSTLSRFILLIVCALISVLAAIYGFWPILVLTMIASIVLLFGYYTAGTVPLAFIQYKREAYLTADKLLDQVQKPELLSKKNRVYYDLLSGLLAKENDQFEIAKKILNSVVDQPQLKETDRALGLMALIDIYLVEKNKTKAKQYFERLKGMQVYPEMVESVRKLQSWLA